MNSVVGKLRVDDLRVWAYHGWYEEERKLGAEYRIDVEAGVVLPGEGIGLEDTVDYQRVVELVKQTMEEEYKLIEESCAAIFSRIQSEFTGISSLWVKVTKLNIPINNLASTSFTIQS